ncbi:Endonuclease/exonuclease/phosphatase [Aspergillus filifer]
MSFDLSSSLESDKPNTQQVYFFDSTTQPPRWRVALRQARKEHLLPSAEGAQAEKIHLLSWNIDFQATAAEERMTAALKYLSELQTNHDTNDGSPTVIMLQEMVPSDLQLIQQASWVREKFYITDITGSQWMSSYGTTMLIDRRLPIERAFRVPYALSAMTRDALFVDITANNTLVRLCTTHLESLLMGRDIRPVQLRLASEYMHGVERAIAFDESGDRIPGPQASILAGDLNAFLSEDDETPGKCHLRDAFLELGGRSDTSAAYTWGFQSPNDRYEPSRMDRALFCGEVEALHYERIGVGLKVNIDAYDSDDSSKDTASDRWEEVWVTDHYGLMVEFRINGCGAE